MIIDGKKIQERMKGELRQEVAGLGRTLRLAIVVVGENPVVEGFVNIKKRFAESIGVEIVEKRFAADASFDEVASALRALAESDHIHGIVVQLPLPPHFDTQTVLDLIPKEKDVDVLSHDANILFEGGKSNVLPPVVGAVAEIFRSGGVDVRGRSALVIGQGRLVGRPVATWLRAQGAVVATVDKPEADLGAIVRRAEIVVSGTGVAGLILPAMLAPGVVLVDAGTSEQGGGVVVGDADPRCAEVAELFTPVPGGVGPVTVALLFKNLVILAR